MAPPFAFNQITRSNGFVMLVKEFPFSAAAVSSIRRRNENRNQKEKMLGMGEAVNHQS
jgi:hypothetical protein